MGFRMIVRVVTHRGTLRSEMGAHVEVRDCKTRVFQ